MTVQSLNQFLSLKLNPQKRWDRNAAPKKSLLANAYFGKSIKEDGPGRASQSAKPRATKDNNHGHHSTAWAGVVTILAQHDLKVVAA